jgi:hypothetical protein
MASSCASFDDKKLHSTMEVCLAGAILLGGYILRVGRLREVLVQYLLPGCFVHILELHKGVGIVEIDLLGPFFELDDRIVNSKLNAKFSTVLVDSGLDFVPRIIALQFVGLR